MEFISKIFNQLTAGPKRKNSNDYDPLEDYIDLDDEIGDQKFVVMYSRYMSIHLGREPLYGTDLYCNMFPLDTIGSGGIIRFWWLAANHPIAIMLGNNKKRAHGTVNTNHFGNCKIYKENVIELCIDSIKSMFIRYDKQLDWNVTVPNSESHLREDDECDIHIVIETE